MDWMSKADDRDQWHRKFAFVPTAVGADTDGNLLWVWLKPYEARLVDPGGYFQTWQHRPIGDATGRWGVRQFDVQVYG